MQTSSSNFLLPISCHSKKREYLHVFQNQCFLVCLLNKKEPLVWFFGWISDTLSIQGSLKPNCRLLWCDVDRVRTFDKAWTKDEKKTESNGSDVRNVTNHTRWTPTSCWISSYNHYMAEKTHGFLAVFFFFFTCIFFGEVMGPCL